jgi:hypothetical protein
MPTIGYESAGFAGVYAGFNGGGALDFQWPQLAWAAVTVGKAFGDEAGFGVFSTFERIHRASMMYAFLMESPTGTVVRANTYLAADPSEKGNISYSIGMTLAKLFSEVFLATPRLLHYSTYAADYTITTGLGASRPDLIGLTATGDWVVFEAKGRSNDLEAGVLATAKLQAQQILSIDGVAPICRVASAAYFSATGLRFALEDPESKGHRKVDLSQKRFIERYDGSLRRVIETRAQNVEVQIAGHRYFGSRYEEADLFLGIAETIGDVGRGRTLSDSAYLGSDGLVVELGPSWREGKMLVQPQQR